MKKIVLIVSAIVFAFILSCNNSGNKNTDQNDKKPKTQTDSLMDYIMEDHDASMAKMNKISSMQKELQQAIDSINNLPVKQKMAASGYKTRLDSVMNELKSAGQGMNKWMDEFNMDSAINDQQQRILYLESEKTKVTNVKESMISALQKADSLLKH